MSERDRKDALIRIICCRLPALTLEQVELIDANTIVMMVNAIEHGDAGEAEWRPEDRK